MVIIVIFSMKKMILLQVYVVNIFGVGFILGAGILGVKILLIIIFI